MRAQSRIDSTEIRLANGWLERRWSVFPGNTVSLCTFPDGMEWMVRTGQEFRVCAESDAFPGGAITLGPHVLAEIEWTDLASPFGAGVVGRYAGPAAMVQVETFLFHEHPGFLRRVSIMNLFPGPLALRAAWVEELPLRDLGLQAQVQHFTRTLPAIHWVSEETAVAVSNAHGGWIFGQVHGGEYALFAPEPSVCALGPGKDVVLAPGKTWTLPEAHGFHFRGALAEALEYGYARFVAARESMRHYDQERERALREPFEE